MKKAFVSVLMCAILLSGLPGGCNNRQAASDLQGGYALKNTVMTQPGAESAPLPALHGRLRADGKKAVNIGQTAAYSVE